MNDAAPAAAPQTPRPIRPDLAIIADMVAPKSRVLDVGCGDGALLDYLWHAKGVDGRGLELRQDRVRACVAHGLSVIQGDAETDLADYPAEAFDYVVLSQALQAMRNPRDMLLQLARVGARPIVSILNYGNWRVRLEPDVVGPHAGARFGRPALVRHRQHPPLHAARLRGAVR